MAGAVQGEDKPPRRRRAETLLSITSCAAVPAGAPLPHKGSGGHVGVVRRLGLALIL